MAHRHWIAALVAAGAVSLAAEQGAATDIVRARLGQRADAALGEAETSGFPGVALVAKGREIVLRTGYGLANRAAGLRIRQRPGQAPEPHKIFTKTAIAQLIAQGKVALPDTIGKLLPTAATSSWGPSSSACPAYATRTTWPSACSDPRA